MLMLSLYTLTDKFPEVSDTRMTGMGFGVWIIWKDELSSAVPRTLNEFGGIKLAEAPNQAFWFFFNNQVFPAMARLYLWSELNPLALFVQVIQAKLIIGSNLEISASVSQELAQQYISAPNDFEVWVHSRFQGHIMNFPGLSVKESAPLGGMAKNLWTRLHVDTSSKYSFAPNLSWIFFIKPENRRIANFKSRWKKFTERILKIQERLKANYKVTDTDFILVELNGLDQMRAWCREVLSFLAKHKDSKDDEYWPCVMAAAEKKEGMPLADDLPSRIGPDWNALTEGELYIPFRSGLLMGPEFIVRDAAVGMVHEEVTDYFRLTLVETAQTSYEGSLEICLPKNFVSGSKNHCFYCGLKNHDPLECPSRQIMNLTPGIWDQVAKLSVQQMDKALREVDSSLAGKNVLDGLTNLLHGTKPPQLMTQALFDHMSGFQHRMMRVAIRTKARDYPQALKNLAEMADDPVWSALENLRHNNYDHVQKVLNQAGQKSSRDCRVPALRALLRLEQGDLKGAREAFRIAKSLAATPFQMSYTSFLDARLYEIQENYERALSMYNQALSHSPEWWDIKYREAVCLAKMSYSEQALSAIDELISKDWHYFNRSILDPELVPIREHLLTMLWPEIRKSERYAKMEKRNLNKAGEKLNTWYDQNSSIYKEISSRIENLDQASEVDNFVAYNQMIRGVRNLERDLQKKIENDIEHANRKIKGFRDRIESLRKEVSWFPFPRLLRGFNKDYNFCAARLKRTGGKVQNPAELKMMQSSIEEIEERLDRMEKRLLSIKTLRNASLFVLILSKRFLILETIGIILSLLVVVPGLFFAQQIGLPWIDVSTIGSKWQFQKGVMLIITLFALGISSVWAAASFERMKSKYFK